MTLAPALDFAASSSRPHDTLNHLVVQLHDVAQRIDRRDSQASAALRSLMGKLQHHPDPRCTGLMVFASAMAERLADANVECANLYLQRFAVPQIELFNLLGRHVPMARMATRIANDVLAQAIQGQAHPTLIDIGIGTGRQFDALLDHLAAARALPRDLTVVGIEPAADALATAQAMLSAKAAQLGVTLHFHGFAATAEALSDADWTQIAQACTAAPAINAAFALHHIADDAQGQDQRNAVLRRLHALAPQALVLAEPDVDHLEPRFFQRFRNCFAHFGAVFQVLDALPLQQAERDALKVGFFGREIVDILATPDSLRRERHESAAAWFQRLAATGFQMRPAGVALPASGHPSVAAEQRGLRVALTGADEALVALLVAVPRAGAAQRA